MRNFRLYLIVGLMTFSIGIFASRFLISSQVKGNMSVSFGNTSVSFEGNNEVSKVTVVTKRCATNITTTTMDGNNPQKVTLKTSDGRVIEISGDLSNPCQK